MIDEGMISDVSAIISGVLSGHEMSMHKKVNERLDVLECFQGHMERDLEGLFNRLDRHTGILRRDPDLVSETPPGRLLVRHARITLFPIRSGSSAVISAVFIISLPLVSI